MKIPNPGRWYSRFILSIRYGLHWRKPVLLRRALSSYAMAILGRHPLRTVDFAPTYSCNLGCEHCFATVLADKSRPVLTVEDYRRIADQAAALGAVHLAFQGGEPLILAELPDLIRAVKPERFIVSVTTNGTLLDASRVQALRQAGLDMLTVSIDSGLAEEHDRFRHSPGAFARAMAGIHLAKDGGLRVCINTMVHHQNLHSEGLQSLISFCRDEELKLGIILPAMAGKWREAYDLALTPDDFTFLRRLMTEHPFLRRDLDANYVRWGCGAVKEMLYVTAYGDVCPCAFIHCSLGNVRQEPLAVIRARGMKLEPFREFAPRCPAMEDQEFIQQRLSVTVGRFRLPVALPEMFPEVSGAAPADGRDQPD